MKKLLLLSLLLAGCGAKSGKTPVRLGSVGPGLQAHYLTTPIARALGYFDQEGLEVSVEQLPSSAKTAQALLGGSVDIAEIGYSQTLQLAAEGEHLLAFFIIQDRPTSGVVASANVQRPEDLKGKIIGVSSTGSATHVWMINWLAKHGLNPADYQVVGIGVGASALAAIESGRIDAACLVGGEHLRYLARNPKARLLVDASSTESINELFGGPNYGGTAYGAPAEWLTKNPDTARRLTRALLKGQQWIKAQSAEEIRARLPSELRSPDTDVDLAILRWSLTQFTTDGQLPAGALKAMQPFFAVRNEKLRDAKIDLAATWTDAYLPPSR